MPDAVPALAPSSASHFLIFQSGGQSYALPAEEVAEIITLPPVARLPQSPPALLGMANLRGTAIPVASLRALLGQSGAGPSSHAVLLGGAAPVALGVDHVEALVALDAGQVETAQAALAAHPGERLRGAFQAAGGAVSKILDIQPLLAAAFTPAPARQASRRATGHAARAAMGEVTAAAEMLIGCEIAGQEFALPLAEVREILPLPPAIATMPRSEALLLGIVALHGGLLPLLSLRGLLGFALPEMPPRAARVIVTMVGGVAAGLVADAARAIIQAAPGTIQPAPAMLAARMGGEARIRSIYREAASGRIVPLLHPGSLFGEEVMSRLARATQHNQAEAGKEPGMEAGETSGPTLQFLVFSLGGEEFALPIAAVDEVAAAPEHVTRLPKTPKFLEGVVNLRGDVLPVIDQRRRFGMPPLAGPAPRRLLIVARTRRHRAGLLVDGVAGVLRAAADDIEAAPGLPGESASLVCGLLNLAASGRMILLLDPDELLSRAERGLLDNFAAARKQAD